jgi:hypothetical protein
VYHHTTAAASDRQILHLVAVIGDSIANAPRLSPSLTNDPSMEEKIDAMDEHATLADPMVSPQGLTVLLPVIPASIRRHIPRLYPSFHRSVRSDSSLSTDRTIHKPKELGFLPSFPEPDLAFYRQKSDLAPAGDLQRPATAGSSSNGQDSCGSSVSGKLSDTSYITTFEENKGVESMGSLVPKYEEESGLRWNRVAPGMYPSRTMPDTLVDVNQCWYCL